MDSYLESKIEDLFTQYNNHLSPGCALGIIKDESFVYKNTFGIANLEHNVPITSKTVFFVLLPALSNLRG